MSTPASDEAKELSQLYQGRFTGDPSHEFEIVKYNITSEDTEEENVEEYKVRKIHGKTNSISRIIDHFFSHFYVKKNVYLPHCGESNRML